MSSLLTTDELAFRFPRKVDGCTCPICMRWGDATLQTSYPSPFALHRLLKWDAEKQIEREPTDEERAQFNAQYPSLAYSRKAGEAAGAGGAAGAKLETPWIKLCLRLLRRLKKEKIAATFLHPVDPVALNIPDYLKLVKHPMDLTTVETKLVATEAKQESAEVGPQPPEVTADAYTEPEDFASDMRMIFRNAFLYNKPELSVHQWAKALSIQFETQYAQL